MRVVFTGGATGGHTTPLLPIIDILRRHGDKNAELFFVGVVTPYVKEVLSAYDVPLYHVPSGKLRRYLSILNLIDLCIWLPFGIFLALWRLWLLMPDVVVSKGGYGSVPAVVAAWFYRIPILLHESDVVPGLANTKLARLASVIAVSFDETRNFFGRHRPKTILTGIPVRLDFDVADSAAAKQFFGFAADDLIILITGGSQGAAQINEVTLAVLPQLITEVKIIHLTGPNHFKTVSTVAAQLLAQSAYKANYLVFPSLRAEMGRALSAADIIVSRAGATTLAEIARLRKPSLLIPLPGSAQDNQRRNAAVFEQRGAALVLDPDNMGQHLFHRSLEELIRTPALRERMSKNCADLDRPQAAADIADLITKLARGLVPTYT